MKRAALLLVVALASAPALAQTQQAVKIQVALSGAVAKTPFGARVPVPVPGAEVYLHPSASSNEHEWIGPVITDNQGRFSFLNVPGGNYVVRVFSGPYRLWQQVVQLPTELAPIVFDDVDVVYYVRPSDGPKVDAALASVRLPYYKATGSVTEPTNALWFGDRVPIRDVKLIAKALMAGGVPLQAIRRFKTGSDWRAVVVQVGASPQHSSDKPLTVADIESAADFPRAR